MAESFAFQIAAEILVKAATLVVHEINLIWGVKADLKKLQLTVSSIQFILLDAAEKKKKNRHVESWLEKVQDVLYDVDDLLDDLMTEKLRREVLIKGSKRKAVRNFFSSSNSLALRVKMSQKLRNINSRLADLDADSKRFEFIKRELDCPIAYPIREETHSFVRAGEVIGRDDDKNRIIQVLLSSSSSGENISVLPIVGLGGLGKTSLAKLVFNDEAFASNFEKRLWICVSVEFDLKMLIEKIMKEATSGVDHAHLELNQLQSCLRSTLGFTKFLLVLDDVWSEDREKWEGLKELLNSGSQGSKIIVTTRKKSTAEMMCTYPPYDLKGLSDEECMAIFVKRAFKEGEEKRYPVLLEIGKAIVRKCKGLPLAVKSVGSLLYTKKEVREWVYVRDNDVWKVAHNDNDVLPILKLSYDEMPLHLKRCFAHCATYPKDLLMDTVMLIKDWMANGLIQLPSDGDTQQLEDIGNQYFHELLSRSFFQIEKMYFLPFVIDVKIHDLVHDLALMVAGKEVLHFRYDIKIISERSRHLLFSPTQIEGEEFPQSLSKLNKCLPRDFHNLRSVRSLFLTCQMKGGFPEKGVAEGLSSLQYLLIKDCYNLESLSEEMKHFTTLRHLFTVACPSLTSLAAESIKHLTCLQHLNIKKCEKLNLIEEESKTIDLPRGLISLQLVDLPKLNKLPSGFERACESIEYIGIQNCTYFEIMPEWLKNCKSLKKLGLINCSEDMENKCKREEGEYWPLISHIHQIFVR